MKSTLNWRGSFVALVTPFTKKGRIDSRSLQALVRFHIEEGTNGIVVCGTTGEASTLSHSEHIDVIKITVEAVEDNIPIIAGTGSNDTKEAIALTVAAEKVGADGILLVSPYYNRPTQEGLRQHFAAVMERTKLPVCIYNVPLRTGVNIDPETVEWLVDKCALSAIKEASGDLVQIGEIIRRTQPLLDVLSGDDMLTLPIMSLGGTGVISVTANVLPYKIRRMVESYEMGKVWDARRYHYELHKITRALFLEPNPVPVKTALAIMGKIKPVFRLPLCRMNPTNIVLLKNELKSQSLLPEK